MSIILVTGGCRSGKSSFALKTAEGLHKPHIYVATCPKLDDDMAARIERHQQQRIGWLTVEEEIDIAGAISTSESGGAILVDCLTLWVNNLIYRDKALSEDLTAEKTREVLDAAAQYDGNVIFVTNELGLGIVPADEMTRRYRDCVGRCNQIVAEQADEVFQLICGIPLQLKGKQ